MPKTCIKFSSILKDKPFHNSINPKRNGDEILYFIHDNRKTRMEMESRNEGSVLSFIINLGFNTCSLKTFLLPTLMNENANGSMCNYNKKATENSMRSKKRVIELHFLI